MRKMETILNKNYKSHPTGRYWMGRFLGRGQNGVVRLATDIQSFKKVAVKTITKKDIAPHQLKSIRTEIEILQKVDHKHVISLLDLVENDNYIHLIQEFVPGGELYKAVEKAGVIQEVEACRIFTQLSEAIQYLHSKGITHRDIKLDNILLDGQRNVRVIDFGISAERSLMYSLCGTSFYLAPELLERKGYTAAADIWSLGVVLFAMTAGFLPFENENESTMFRLIKLGKYEPPGYISPELKDLISQLIQTNIRARATIDKIFDHPWINMKKTSLHRDLLHDHAMQPVMGYQIDAAILLNRRYHERVLQQQASLPSSQAQSRRYPSINEILTVRKPSLVTAGPAASRLAMLNKNWYQPGHRQSQSDYNIAQGNNIFPPHPIHQSSAPARSRRLVAPPPQNIPLGSHTGKIKTRRLCLVSDSKSSSRLPQMPGQRVLDLRGHRMTSLREKSMQQRARSNMPNQFAQMAERSAQYFAKMASPKPSTRSLTPVTSVRQISPVPVPNSESRAMRGFGGNIGLGAMLGGAADLANQTLPRNNLARLGSIPNNCSVQPIVVARRSVQPVVLKPPTTRSITPITSTRQLSPITSVRQLTPPITSIRNLSPVPAPNSQISVMKGGGGIKGLGDMLGGAAKLANQRPPTSLGLPPRSPRINQRKLLKRKAEDGKGFELQKPDRDKPALSNYSHSA